MYCKKKFGKDAEILAPGDVRQKACDAARDRGDVRAVGTSIARPNDMEIFRRKPRGKDSKKATEEKKLFFSRYDRQIPI